MRVVFPSLAALAALLAVAPAGAQQQDPLAATVEAQARAAAPDAARVAMYQGFSTEDDGRTDWNFPLDATQCYWFSGVGGPGVRHLFLYLWNPSGKRVADKKPDAPNVLMAYCPEVSGMFHLQAKTEEGHGAYTVGVYSKPAPPKVAPPPPPPPPPPLDLSAICDSVATASAPGAKRGGPLLPGAGDKTDWPIMLEPGSCYWLVACGEPGKVRAMALFLWGPDGKRITENKSDVPTPSLGHCPVMPGMHKAQAKVVKGGGVFGLGIYAKKMGQ